MAGEREGPMEGLVGIERAGALSNRPGTLFFLNSGAELCLMEACFCCIGGGRLDPSGTK